MIFFKLNGMKLEVFIFAGACFFAVDAFYDNKYTKSLWNYKKHAKIATILFGAFSMYIFFKRNPTESVNLMTYLTGAIRYMPIDKNSRDLITPWLQDHNVQRIQTSGILSTGRNVSGAKKKYVAAAQGWKCKDCQAQLDAWYEVDHKTRLADGGSNHISNLVALCRNCHGKKTMLENIR